MKYIKLYESFETDIEDILLEITDLGYTAQISAIITSLGHHTIINIYKVGDTTSIIRELQNININEIKDCVLRLIDYLGDKFITCEIHKNGTWRKFNFTEDSDFTEPVKSMLIKYYR